MTKARDIASAIPAPSTVSSAELGYLDGVTSAVQTQLDAKTAKSTLSTTGDIYYASSANTPARLGIGSTDQILKVSGGVPVWATPASGGGMTLLSTTSLSGTSTTISSINQSYIDLYVVVDYMYFTAGGSGHFTISPNAQTTLSTTSGLYFNTGSGGLIEYRGNSTIGIGGATIQGNTPSNIFVLKISQYSNSNVVKALDFFGGYTDSGGIKNGFNYAGFFRSETAITSLVFATAGGYSFGTQYAPPQVNIYGVK